MPHGAAIDQGTTSSRAIVFRATSRSPRRAAGIPAAFPASGWVEPTRGHLDSTDFAPARGAEESGIGAKDVAAIGINQPARNQPWCGPPRNAVHRAIVWEEPHAISAPLKAEATSREYPRKPA